MYGRVIRLGIASTSRYRTGCFLFTDQLSCLHHFVNAPYRRPSHLFLHTTEFFASAFTSTLQLDPLKHYFVDDSRLNILGTVREGWGHSVWFDEREGGEEKTNGNGNGNGHGNGIGEATKSEKAVLNWGNQGEGKVSVIRDMQGRSDFARWYSDERADTHYLT